MRKLNYTYYFSVEGETEKWYLNWLQERINESADVPRTVKLDVQVQKDPMKRVKQMVILEPTEITHVFDRESEDAVHIKQFAQTLTRMKDAQKLGKKVKYQLGYSNFTFELWMILHKADLYSSKANRKDYLTPLNMAFGEHFESLDEYKQEKNFQRVLNKLTLNDVKDAVCRSRLIMKRNEETISLQKYKGYSFYDHNPSLSVWESIEKILKDVGI